MSLATAKATGGEFVGRSAELTRLRARLARAKAGSGAVVALVGEAGIGKTRTALAFADEAAAAGAIVAVGTCGEGDWTAPYLPWSQALGAVATAVGPKAARAAVGAGRGTLAWFVREFTATAPAPLLDPRDERLRLHCSVTELLSRASVRARPLVLLIDDLHWADDDSVALLQTVARRASREPWVVVLAYREGEVDHGRTPLGDVLGALKDGDFERIPLRGLAPSEVSEVAQRCAGRPLPESFVRVLYDETVGNPLYLREVVRLLADEQLLAGARIEDVTMRQLGVPRGVREVIARRVARLVEPASRVLRVVSAMVQPASMPLLAAVTELEDAPLRGAVAMALSSGLLHAVGGERYEASHALVRRVIHDGLVPDLRARLHRRIAEALDSNEERAPGREAAIAGAYVASSAIPGAGAGVPHAIEAAREATASCAFECAVSFLRRARSLAAGGEVPARAEALCELALAEAHALRAEDAVATVDAAIAALEEAKTPPVEIAGFLSEVASALRSGEASPSRWAPLVVRGLEYAKESRSLVWARLSLLEDRYESLAYGAVNLARALPRDEAAVRLARQEGDEDDYAATLDDAPRTRAEAAQLVKRAATWQRPTARLRALEVAVGELVYRHAAFADAREHVATMLHVAEKAGSIPGQVEALVHMAACDAALGFLGRATQLRAQAQEVASAAGVSSPRLGQVSWLGLDATLAYYVGGDWRSIAESAARANADPAARRSPVGHVAAAIAALAYALGGHAREARSLVGHLAPIFERCDARLYHYGVALGCATTAVWHLGARDFAEKYLALERGAPPLAGTAPYASRDLNLGRMAVLLEKWEEAREHLNRADVLLARRRRRPLHAIALHDGASAVLRSGDTTGAAPARAKLAASLRAFRLLRMDPWILHTHQLLELPRPAYPDGLTSREVEILAMIGEGRAPEGIALALGVAAGLARKETAEACAKIGAKGRAAVAAYAKGHRLVALA
jgi:DNA-binding NarL/FixJ family response regulator